VIETSHRVKLLDSQNRPEAPDQQARHYALPIGKNNTLIRQRSDGHYRSGSTPGLFQTVGAHFPVHGTPHGDHSIDRPADVYITPTTVWSQSSADDREVYNLRAAFDPQEVNEIAPTDTGLNVPATEGVTGNVAVLVDGTSEILQKRCLCT